MKQDIIKFNFKFNNNDFFVSEKNELAYTIIKSWPNWSNRFVYVYGPDKCGKSQICSIWRKLSKGVLINKDNFSEKLLNLNDIEYIKSENWVIDDVDYIVEFNDNFYQEKILNLINIIKTSNESHMLMTAKKIPKLLNLNLKDLISRLSSSIVVEMNDPDESLIKKIIEKYLSDRNIYISEEELNYLICRIERSYKSAIKIAKLVDEKSLQNKRKINKLFLKTIIE